MISISPKKVLRFLTLFICGFGIIGFSIRVVRYLLDRGGLWGISRLFDLDTENNIPTWYSSITLFFCAILLGLIAIQKRQNGDRFSNYWLGLSGTFAFLSLDEAASIHELFIPLGETLGASGILTFFWVIPALIAVLVVAIIYWKFLVQLPLKTRQLTAIAAACFLGGAIGLEMVAGYYISLHPDVLMWDVSADWYGVTLSAIMIAEELLEMLGVAILIYALMSYLIEEVNGVSIYGSKNNLSHRVDSHTLQSGRLKR